MDCFFATHVRSDSNGDGKSAVVMFCIPEVGIRFKAPFDAVDENHSDLAALLALLEFIDSNQKYFTNQTFQIFGNSLTVVNQVNGREAPPDIFAHLMDRASQYREKYHFSLGWIPTAENAAIDPLFN